MLVCVVCACVCVCDKVYVKIWVYMYIWWTKCSNFVPHTHLKLLVLGIGLICAADGFLCFGCLYRHRCYVNHLVGLCAHMLCLCSKQAYCVVHCNILKCTEVCVMHCDIL